MDFNIKTPLKPRGDQPKAIEALVNNYKSGAKHQVLHGVTGSGKTYTAAHAIEKINKPTLVIAHNKMLAWQLYREFKELFPKNAVHYFVSYYDYYQPEAYIPASDTYIAKDASVNKKIDQMRHAAVQDLLVRDDVLVVASVSCIYNIGSPEIYQKVSLDFACEQTITRAQIMRALVSIGFARNDFDPHYGQFSAKANRIEIHPATGDTPIVIELGKNQIENIYKQNRYSPYHTGQTRVVDSVKIFPANFWATTDNRLKIALNNIRAELAERLRELKKQNKEVEAYRLQQKTGYDLELIEQLGYCGGIENYSRHLDFREPDQAPHTLIDYFGKDFLTIVDESHMTIPQIRGMYAGDNARKKSLIEHGFRLPSAVDNRPLKFEEFEKKLVQTIHMSATPSEYELSHSRSNVVEQIVRPTGLLDPPIEVRSTKNQMANAITEIKKTIKNGQRALVVTITKRLSEEIAEYLNQEGIKVAYIHSEINTLNRIPIMQKLREGEYDVLVGVNLLREGLDFPEVSLVVIFDADKEGFLRNETTLLQTIGRAARHVEGRAIMYGDKLTDSIKKTLKETERRRKIQTAFNKQHKITPQSIKKEIYKMPQELQLDEKEKTDMAPYKNMAVKQIEKEMKAAAKEMDFEKAAKLRDEIKKISNS